VPQCGDCTLQGTHCILQCSVNSFSRMRLPSLTTLHAYCVPDEQTHRRATSRTVTTANTQRDGTVRPRVL